MKTSNGNRRVMSIRTGFHILCNVLLLTRSGVFFLFSPKSNCVSAPSHWTSVHFSIIFTSVRFGIYAGIAGAFHIGG